MEIRGRRRERKRGRKREKGEKVKYLSVRGSVVLSVAEFWVWLLL